MKTQTGQEHIPEESANGVENQITALEQKLEKHWSAKKDAFVKWNGGLISKAAYEGIYAEHHQEIQRLNLEVERLKGILTEGKQSENVDPEQLAEAADSDELTREMVDALIQAVRVFDDGRISIEWKSP